MFWWNKLYLWIRSLQIHSQTGAKQTSRSKCSISRFWSASFRTVSVSKVSAGNILFADAVPKLADQKQEIGHLEWDVWIDSSLGVYLRISFSPQILCLWIRSSIFKNLIDTLTLNWMFTQSILAAPQLSHYVMFASMFYKINIQYQVLLKTNWISYFW